MQFLPTVDGSYTIYHPVYEEHYHSLSGAYEEALEKHVKPLAIQNGMKILDFCFGLGYNSIVAAHFHSDLTIVGLENDIQVIRAMQNLQVPKEFETTYTQFRLLAEKKKQIDNHRNSITIILGDAAESVQKLPSSFFDCVFFDPFSPQKQPDLWDTSIFKEMYRILKIDGKLSTYSCARMVRKNMKSAGFMVTDGPCVGRRAPATIAHKPEK